MQKLGWEVGIMKNTSDKLNAKILSRSRALSHIYRRHGAHQIGVLFCRLLLILLRINEKFPPPSLNIFM